MSQEIHITITVEQPAPPAPQRRVIVGLRSERIPLALRRLIARMTRRKAGGGCVRCGLPWLFPIQHMTDLGGGCAIFPLCEGCWRDLDPAARLPWYRKVHDAQVDRIQEAYRHGLVDEKMIHDAPIAWERIAQVVAGGG